VFALTALTFAVTYWLCNELRKSSMHPIRGSKVDDVRRTTTGGYETADEIEGGGFKAPEQAKV